MPDFALHERLAADTVEAARWPLCRVLLMNDSRYPWLILVPARADMTEIHRLDPSDQAQLMTEITRASRALETLHRPDKINVAALGNMVPQLHIHVVARFRTDDAWPGPIWGAHPPRPYAAADLDRALNTLRALLR
ncbi:MAG: HIT family protein [Proteobacteria bacterium]|nr:HIT family protein [Pseudomonadota bacterium]